MVSELSGSDYKQEQEMDERKINKILYFSKGADSAKWSLVFGLILSYS